MTYSTTRRELLQGLAAAGLVASPFIPRLANASDSQIRMVAAIFYESYATEALRRARRYAGDDGFVASMPQLLHARTTADYDNIIWNTWFTAHSEESVVTSPQGNQIVVAVHGGGIFASPDRFERSLRANLSRKNTEGLTGQYAAKISATEARDIQEGVLPDGSEFPIYSFTDFRQGVSDLPMRYGVAVDFDVASAAADDYTSFEQLADDPLMIVRAGGPEALAAYLDRARSRNEAELMGNWHPYDRIDPTVPQSRILRVTGNKGGKGSDGSDPGLGWGYDSDYGMTAGGFIGLARYVAVAPREESTSLQYLDFLAS